MASSQKISELTTAGPLTGAELVPIVQNGGTLQTTVSVVAAFAVVSLTPVVSALATQITQVSSAVSAVNVRVDTVSAAVSSLDVRLTQVSAVGTANTAAIVSTNNAVSALEVRVSAVSATGVANGIQIADVSALTSVNAAAITSVEADISALDVRVSVVEAALSVIGGVTAIAGLVSSVGVLEADVSALTIRVAAVSAATSVNADAITSINAAVSVNADALASVASIVSTESLRLDVVSAATSVNAAAITSVNAVVSTKVNRSGDFLENVRYINFDTSVSTVPTTVGQVAWNSEDGTVEVGLYSNVMLKTGQNTYFYVKNENSITIPKGRLVMAVGTLGASGKITAELAIADGTVSPEYFLGVAANNIAVGDFGYVTAFGLVRGFDTTGAQYAETWADGDLLYPRPAGVGGLTNAPPAFPGFSVPVAIVILAASASTGSIFVRMKSGEYLSQLHDVDLSAVAANDILVYNTSLSAWTNSPLLVQTQASVSALNIQVADVSALTSANAAAITSVNNVVSALQVQVNAVSVSVEQRVLKAGDTMTGALNISTSADAQAVSVAGYATFSSRVSISAGFYTGVQNYQDVVLQRATFKDYAIAVVVKGSVSATTSLDLVEGNYFTAIAAGSTTFVFANPPVSVSGTSGLAAGGFILELANGGAATVTWPAAVKWPGGTSPTLTAAGTDVFVFITDDGGTVWRGVQSMKDSK